MRSLGAYLPLQITALMPVFRGQDLGIYGGPASSAALIIGVPLILAGLLAGVSRLLGPTSPRRRAFVEGLFLGAFCVGFWLIIDPGPLDGLPHALVMLAPFVLGPALVGSARRWIMPLVLIASAGCMTESDLYGALAVPVFAVGITEQPLVRAGFFAVTPQGQEAGRLSVTPDEVGRVTLEGRDPILPDAFSIVPACVADLDDDGVAAFDPGCLDDGSYILAAFHDSNDDGRWSGSYRGEREAIRAPMRHEGTLDHVLVDYAYVSAWDFVEAHTVSADTFQSRQRVTDQMRNAFDIRIESAADDAANADAGEP